MAVIHGLDELRRILRQGGKALPRTLGKAAKAVSLAVVEKAKPKVSSAGAPSARMASLPKGLSARGTQRFAAVSIRSTKSRPTLAAVMGVKSHPVFGRHRPLSSLSHKPWNPWLGTTWKPEDLYGIGPAFDMSQEDMQELWFQGFMEALHGLDA